MPFSASFLLDPSGFWGQQSQLSVDGGVMVLLSTKNGLKTNDSFKPEVAK